MKHLLLSAQSLAWLAVGCHADAPATATSLRSADNDTGCPTPYDTLQVAGDRVLRLKPIPEATYRQTPTDTLFAATNYEAALAVDTGRGHRQGDDLLLQPTPGPTVTFHNRWEAQQTSGKAGCLVRL